MKKLLDLLFGIDRSVAVPPPPVFQRNRSSEGTAGVKVSSRTARAEKEKVDAETGTTEWTNVTSTKKQRRSIERSAAFTVYDMTVLAMPEFVTLDEIKYRSGKVVWADGISNRKANDDSRVNNIEGFGETTRKLYWRAYGVSHQMQLEGEEEE